MSVAPPRADESAIPEWARELARGLAAPVQARPQPNSDQLTLAAQPRTETPKLTIHKLDVQIVNQPPAPVVQFIQSPAAEVESPTGTADLDRHYLGRFNFVI